MSFLKTSLFIIVGVLLVCLFLVFVNGQRVTNVLAENIPISDIPRTPYILRSTETEIIPIIPAFIDFDPNVLNLKSKGQNVTVYIELPNNCHY